MSLKYEQCYALKRTRKFLRAIVVGPRMPTKSLRDEASSCLHHFPMLNENGQPMWSQDPFTNEDGSMGGPHDGKEAK